MKRNSLFFSFFSLLFCFSCAYIHAAQSGYEKCTSLFSVLKAQNTSPQIQHLIFNENNDFPFNIIDTFGLTSEEKNGTKKADETLLELFIVFKVEDFFENHELVKKIVGKIKDIDKKFSVSLVFTYGDDVSSEELGKISGTKVFSERIRNSSESAIICFSLSDENAVIPGGKGGISPSFLTKSASDAFRTNELEYSLKAGLINFLYADGFLKTERRSDLFFENGFSAIAVNFSSDEKNLEKLPEFIEALVENISPEESINSQKHANLFLIGQKFFSTSETFTIILFLLFVFINLLIICEIPIVSKRKYINNEKEIRKFWYIIPLSIVTNCAALFVSGFLVSFFEKLFVMNIYIQLSLKLVIAFALSSFAFFITLKKQGSVDSKVYFFLLSISGIINLVFFTALDISLFYLFALECVLIYISRPDKYMITLSTGFFLFLMPFVPYAIQIIKYSETSFLEKLTRNGFLSNTGIAILLVPFEIMWLRILGHLNQKWRRADDSVRKFYIQNALWILAAFVLCIAIVIAADFMIPEKYKKSYLKKETIIERSHDDFIDINASVIEYFGETNVILNVKTNEACEEVYVQVSSASENPIIYSDNDFVQNLETKTDYFKIPLNPPEKMTFRYIANPSSNATVKVNATRLNEEKSENGKKIYDFYEKTYEIKKTGGEK